MWNMATPSSFLQRKNHHICSSEPRQFSPFSLHMQLRVLFVCFVFINAKSVLLGIPSSFQTPTETRLKEHQANTSLWIPSSDILKTVQKSRACKLAGLKQLKVTNSPASLYEHLSTSPFTRGHTEGKLKAAPDTNQKVLTRAKTPDNADRRFPFENEAHKHPFLPRPCHHCQFCTPGSFWYSYGRYQQEISTRVIRKAQDTNQEHTEELLQCSPVNLRVLRKQIDLYQNLKNA